LRAITYDNHEYKTLVNILEKSLDKKDTPTFSTKVIPLEQTAYVRAANSYSSSMEANL